MVRQATVLTLLGVLASAAPFAQGHGYTPQDVENGGQLYQANCTACHGPDGDGLPGVNLGVNRFRRGTTDDELMRIILGGIPGTAMPPSSFSEGQALTIVAYLRSLASAPRGASIPGDSARGKALFEGKGKCQTCHSVGGVGSRTGPALTEIGSFRRAIELQRSLVEPSAEIRSENRVVRAVTRDGRTITGRLFNHDTFTVQLIDSSERLTLVDKSTLREYTIVKESPMPSYKNTFNAQELADVVTFLTTLRVRR